MVSGPEVIHQDHNEDTSSKPSFLTMTRAHEYETHVAEDQIEITKASSTEEDWPFVDNVLALRDTSDTSRYFESNNSRDSVASRQNVTVNTHDSILDLESQAGDDDISFCDEEENIMGIIDLSTNSKSFDRQIQNEIEAHIVSPCSSDDKEDEKVKKQPKAEELKHEKSSGIMSNLTLYSVTDTFVDSLCTSTACVVSDNYYSHPNRTSKKQKSAIASMDDRINKLQESCESAMRDSSKMGKQKSSPKTVVSLDIWQLLGCSDLPGEAEMEEIWSLRTSPQMLQYGQRTRGQKDTKQPVRASIKKRMKRIHRLRMDGRRISGVSRHGVTITNHCIDPSNHSLSNIRNDIHMNKSLNNIGLLNETNEVTNIEYKPSQNLKYNQPSYRAIDKTYSMLDDPLASFIGKGKVPPIPVHVEDGYDSDPEINYYSASTPMIMDYSSLSQSDRMEDDCVSLSLPAVSAAPQHRDVLRVDPIPTDETEMRESVQQTLNSTWTLTWHPNAENRKEYNISHSKPICINMWLERGAVMTNSGVVVEPAFMWRDAYQPLLLTQHRLNNSSQKPWSMRLLNACRITPYFSAQNSIDRNKYPLARKNSSFLLKSCGGEEFVLEAKNTEDAIAITQRWKLVVARFACLAVTEDVGGIAREFFHPTSDSKMLTVPDPNNMF